MKGQYPLLGHEWTEGSAIPLVWLDQVGMGEGTSVSQWKEPPYKIWNTATFQTFCGAVGPHRGWQAPGHHNIREVAWPPMLV